MKPLKLHIDTRPQEQPQNTYPYGKNGIQFDLLGASFNEPGFRKLAAKAPYRINGIIETDTFPVVLSTNNTHSAIGLLNTETGDYVAIVDDAVQTDVYPLGFSDRYWITGVSQRNYKGELIIAFTDKNGFPKALNCDDPELTSPDDLRLFPFFHPPVIGVSQDLGGSLPPGAYYVSTNYEKNDGTTTPWSDVSKVCIITPGVVQGIFDKSLLITITNADTRYNFVNMAIISQVDGQIKVVALLDSVPISGANVTLTYTGSNPSEDMDISEILTKPAQYDKVDTIGQLNDALYIVGLQDEEPITDMQQYANLIQASWVSDLISATAPPAEHVTGLVRGMAHQEVYALYVRYRRTRGGNTEWFHIPGLLPNPEDLVDSTEATTGGSLTTVPKYKVEDTIRSFNAGTFSGRMGVWINDTETYPDTADYDSTALGGQNLRGQKVRHHRMPSHLWCKANLYSSDNDYGRTKLDLLYLKVANIVIPPKYNGIIDGYEIGYAKRSTGNMTVLGQGLLMHGAVNNTDTGIATGSGAHIYTSGGNWKTDIFHPSGDYDTDQQLVELRQDTMRFHGFDVLANKPSIAPAFIAGQIKLRRDSLDLEYYEDGDDDGSQTLPLVNLIDYTNGTTDPVQVLPTEKLRAISSSFYLTGNISANDFINSRHENCFAGVLRGGSWTQNIGTASYHLVGDGITVANIGAPHNVAVDEWFEEAFLINLLALRTDIYQNFYSQELVSAGEARDLDDLSAFKGGDVFASDYTFHTYGRHDAVDTHGEGIEGRKVIRRFVCETISNIHLRFEITGNEYSKWYPHNSIVKQNPDQCYITRFDRSIDPNQFGYSRDFNALNDLLDSTTFSPYLEVLTEHPYRIHRGGKLPRQGKARSWRTFLPLDYYELQKNMGRPIHIEGMDDRLMIHCENALFLTQDKAKLDGGVLSVTLGTGDIFQFEPQEAQSAKLGYMGNRNELASLRCPLGYVFCDAQLGEIYIFKGKPQLLNEGINTFLRQWLKLDARNNFTGNGITLGWDQKYKRILLTVKNRSFEGNPLTIKYYYDTDDFWDDLQEGDVVLIEGRLTVFRGVNDTIYDCEPDSIYSWNPIDPYCVTTGDSPDENTGMKGFANRERYTNGVADGTTEVNDEDGDGPYFPPVQDLLACPLSDPDPGNSPEDTYACGDTLTDSYLPTGIHTYDSYDLDTTALATMSAHWNSYDRPNRFSIYDDLDNLIVTSGWVGTAAYPGPWGSSLSTSQTGIITFSVNPARSYRLKVEAGNAGPGGLSDSWTVLLSCT